MEKNLSERIKYLQEKKDELELVKVKIEDERRKFETILEGMNEWASKVSEEINSLGETTVPVKLSDLVQEMANLTGVNVLDMGIKITTDVVYWGKNDKKKMLELINSEVIPLKCKGDSVWKNHWLLELFANKNENMHAEKNQSFCFSMLFDLRLDEVQADGKTLFEHCAAEIGYDKILHKHYTFLAIDENIGDLILNLSLKDLARDDSVEKYNTWYPSCILSLAVINCVERENSKYDHPKQKKVRQI